VSNSACAAPSEHLTVCGRIMSRMVTQRLPLGQHPRVGNMPTYGCTDVIALSTAQQPCLLPRQNHRQGSGPANTGAPRQQLANKLCLPPRPAQAQYPPVSQGREQAEQLTGLPHLHWQLLQDRQPRLKLSIQQHQQPRLGQCHLLP
jgi:hypothetical protein